MGYRLAEQEDWRRKYAESLRAFEQESSEARSRLDTLHKLVGRLCLAAQGQSDRLDEELQRLREAIKQQTAGAKLEPFSLAIADAVKLMDIARRNASAPARIDTAPVSPPAVADAAELSPSTVDRLLAMPAANAPLAPLAAPAEFRTTAPAVEAGENAPQPVGPSQEAASRIRAILSQLLGELAVDSTLTREAHDLDALLGNAIDIDGFPDLLGRVGALVTQRIGGLEKCRREMEALLAQMIGQLDSLTGYFAGQSEDDNQRTSSTDTLNAQISSEMRALGENVANGNDLELIRAQLKVRMSSISQHLQGFRQREVERTRQSRERSEGMRRRMEEMDLEVRKLQTRLSDEKRLMLLDAVTGVPNRLAWDQRITEEHGRWQRFGQPLCLALWDVDKFKSINDNYGHRAGDKVLAVVAEQLASSIRSTDFVARYGGEEFAMLLPGINCEHAVKLVDQVRQSVAAIGFHFRGAPVSVTISCGLTTLRTGDRPEDAFERADKALYEAKNAGRNRVVSA